MDTENENASSSISSIGINGTGASRKLKPVVQRKNKIGTNKGKKNNINGVTRNIGKAQSMSALPSNSNSNNPFEDTNALGDGGGEFLLQGNLLDTWGERGGGGFGSLPSSTIESNQEQYSARPGSSAQSSSRGGARGGDGGQSQRGSTPDAGTDGNRGDRLAPVRNQQMSLDEDYEQEFEDA